MISTCEVPWSARPITSKVTGNRQEDLVRSSQSEVTGRSVRPSSSRVVGACRNRHQRRWSATDRHLFCVNIRRTGLGDRVRYVDRLRNTSLTVYEVVRAQLHAFNCSLAKLRLVTSYSSGASQLIVMSFNYIDYCPIVYDWYNRPTTNIEKILNCYVCVS